MAAPAIVIDVRSVSPAARATGLAAAGAAQILSWSPSWRYPELYCVNECGRQPHVLVDHAWRGRWLSYCTACGVVDLAM